ncbi:MAG: DUF2141 domain-containing protein [Chlorobiaceae bacterium]
MKKTLLLLFLLTTFAVTASGEESASALPAAGSVGTIRMHFSKLRSTKGQIRIALFSSREGFPGKVQKAVRIAVLQADDPKLESVMEGVPYGVYAVSAYHDENGNGKMDTVFLIGIPKEGVGCSNNPKSRMGPPSYADSKFTLGESVIELDIAMRYL